MSCTLGKDGLAEGVRRKASPAGRVRDPSTGPHTDRCAGCQLLSGVLTNGPNDGGQTRPSDEEISERLAEPRHPTTSVPGWAWLSKLQTKCRTGSRPWKKGDSRVRHGLGSGGHIPGARQGPVFQKSSQHPSSSGPIPRTRG